MRLDKFGAEYHRLRRQKLREAGLCLRCRKPKGEMRLYNQFCAPCDLQDQRGEAEYVERNETYAGERICVRCEEMGKTTKFWSDDKRSITRCDACRDWMDSVEDGLAHDLARYDVGAGKGGWEEVRRKTTTHIGRQITGEDQRKLLRQIRQRDMQGVTCRSLSRAEIERDYPAERLDQILAKCEINARSLHSEMGEIKRL